jgi:hypothetical protein
MPELKDGGPAFPSETREVVYAWRGGQALKAQQQIGGMSLRDYIATHAMYPAFSEIVRQMGEGERSGFGWDTVADQAYLIADAMLQAREK